MTATERTRQDPSGLVTSAPLHAPYYTGATVIAAGRAHLVPHTTGLPIEKGTAVNNAYTTRENGCWREQPTTPLSHREEGVGHGRRHV